MFPMTQMIARNDPTGKIAIRVLAALVATFAVLALAGSLA